MKKLVIVVSFALILGVIGNAFGAGKPKVSMVKARQIAQKRVSGKIQSAELEREKGRLVYSFDIRTRRGTIREVWVDANSGAVVSVKTESPRQERMETSNEKREN